MTKISETFPYADVLEVADVVVGAVVEEAAVVFVGAVVEEAAVVFVGASAVVASVVYSLVAELEDASPSEQGGKMSISTIRAMAFPFLNGSLVSSSIQESFCCTYL